MGNGEEFRRSLNCFFLIMSRVGRLVDWVFLLMSGIFRGSRIIFHTKN